MEAAVLGRGILYTGSAVCAGNIDFISGPESLLDQHSVSYEAGRFDFKRHERMF